MKKKRIFARVLAIILVVAMLVGSAIYVVELIAPAKVNVYAADAVSTKTAYEKLDKLKEVIKLIEENYKEKVDVNKLVNSAYEGVFNALDEWSVFYASSVEKEAFTSTLTNEKYSGVGLTITTEGDNFLISAVNPKGPGKEAGIKAGDYITAVDGKSTKTWTLEKVSSALRGSSGTKVKISILRKGQALEFTVTRKELVTTDVDYYMIEGSKIAYIEIASFGESCAEDFITACDELKAAGATSFIIDLRDNPGGYMDAALQCAASVLKPGDNLLYYYQNGKEIDHMHVVGTDDSPRDKIVILVNENSASAAEVFTAALKDNKAATVVGLNTYGKGVGQEIYELEDGSSFKLSTLYFTGPKKLAIDGKGIAPDYLVFNNGGLSSEEASKIAASVIPMNENKKYQKQGQYGLNVLAAQQRLKAMGFNLETNSMLDADTIAALKEVQKQAALSPYGGLDFSTMKALEEKFNAFLYGAEDAQLAKAIELAK